MKTIALLACICVAGCSKKPEAKPEAKAEPVAKATDPTTAEPTTAAKPEPTTAAKGGLVLGDATVYELVDRRYTKLDKPKRDVVMHADGKVELINDKTDKPWLTFNVKADGSVTADGKPMGAITDKGITDQNGKVVVPLDGNTVTITIEGKPIKVVLAADGNVTVLDNPYGNKWRIEAKDPAVMRSAFLVLALNMKTALD